MILDPRYKIFHNSNAFDKLKIRFGSPAISPEWARGEPQRWAVQTLCEWGFRRLTPDSADKISVREFAFDLWDRIQELGVSESQLSLQGIPFPRLDAHCTVYIAQNDSGTTRPCFFSHDRKLTPGCSPVYREDPMFITSLGLCICLACGPTITGDEEIVTCEPQRQDLVDITTPVAANPAGHQYGKNRVAGLKLETRMQPCQPMSLNAAAMRRTWVFRRLLVHALWKFFPEKTAKIDVSRLDVDPSLVFEGYTHQTLVERLKGNPSGPAEEMFIVQNDCSLCPLQCQSGACRNIIKSGQPAFAGKLGHFVQCLSCGPLITGDEEILVRYDYKGPVAEVQRGRSKRGFHFASPKRQKVLGLKPNQLPILPQLPAQQQEEEKCEECVVCMDGPSTWAAIPCGHQSYCKDCLEKIAQCSVCRKPIQMKIQIFKS